MPGDVNRFASHCTIGPATFLVIYLWVNWIFDCIIHLMVHLLDLTTN